MKNSFLFFSFALLIQISVKAQVKIGDNTANINSASLLELETTDKGFVFPRISLTDIASSLPLPAGLLAGTVVYNTNAAITNGNGIGLYMWGGLVWMSINTGPISGTAWVLTGNTGTNYSTNFIGTIDKVSFRMRTNNIQRMFIDSIGSVAIGSEAFDPFNRERLLVDYGSTSSNTIANFRGNINNYLQINLQNTSSGGNASTDYVATANDGTDSTYYVDMGINSSTYNPSPANWGSAHDAYFYSNSKNLLMGTQADSSDVIFLLGGGQLKNTVLQLKGPSGAVVVGSGEGTDSAVGNIIRAPNARIDAADVAGGNLTISGGRSTGTVKGGDLLLKGGGSGLTSSGNGGNVNIEGGNSINGTDGSVSINVGKSSGDVKIGGNGNNILFSKFSTAGGLYYTAKSSGQVSTTGANMVWDSINKRLGIGITNPGNKLSVSGINPLYLGGVLPTASFSTDSILTIFNGVVKKTPYSSLPTGGGGGNGWLLTGNSGTNATNFIGTTDSIGLSIRTNNIQRLLVGPQDVKAKLGKGGKFLIVNNGTPPNEFVKLLIRETGEVNWFLDGESMYIRQSNFEYDPGKFGTYDFFHVDGTNGRLGFNVLSNTAGGLDDNLPLTSSVNLFGSIATRVRLVDGSTNYAIKQDDHVMIIDKQDLGTNDMTLPRVNLSKGRELYFKRNGFNRGVIAVKPQAGEKFNGIVDSHIDLKLGNASMMVVCDGDSWWVVTEVSARLQTLVISSSTSVTTEDAVEVNFTAANQTIDVNLPSVADYDGKRYEIKRNADGTIFPGNVLRIVPASGENLDQSTFASPYIMENDFESVTVQSDGTRWIIINDYNAENAVVAVITAYTPNKNDKTILADASSASFTVTLPGAATVEAGKTYTVKRTNAGVNTVIVDGNGSETIDGITSLRLNQRFDYLQLQSDGTNWMVISERISPSLVVNPALPYVATVYDGTISSNGNGTINLPSAAAVLGGKIFTIKNSATAGNPTLTVDPNGAETVDGLATWPVSMGQFVTIQSDGTNWIVIGQ